MLAPIEASLLVKAERGGQCGDHFLGDQCRVRGRFHPFQDNGEFVAPQPRHGVVVAHATAQPCPRLLQQPIAQRMPKRVVHQLEAVEIDEHQGETVPVTPGIGNGAR